ncbi:hypothetical protein OSB04_028496 [Centaurea solstitialis]|uniref:Uncharacterized protein n=1 Tax=Centaurea solstitialis TaxID=347529 RepID=A0AA38STA6_9ASTR|nr:hypothetical protein OSB04_028496 [Centaurea solstitialis]
MAEFASAIVGPVVDSLMVPVKRHLSYLFLSTEHVRNMTARMKQLEGTSVDVKNHKDTNDINTLEIPARVPGWLEEVAKIKTDAETISRNENGCFNIKARHQMGRNALRTIQEIDRLLQEGLAFTWTDAQKPLGRVDTRSASRSAPSGGDGIGEDFKSRATTFDDALKLLQQDHKTQVIALCGMGGVGKTTMMLQLKKVAEEKKMFDWIVKVVIGKQPNWHYVQQAVAENLGNSLTEETQTTRADRLRTRFEETLKKSEKGILVILDDVWEKVELNDIGLSPFPNRVKLFLTSRYENICRTTGVHEGNLDLKVLRVEVLEQTEAHKFFCQITKISEEFDRELYQIGGEIVKKCSCLPLAIKLIGPTLIFEEKSIWTDTLTLLRNNNLDQDVHEVIRISYDYLRDQEDKEIFLLCGLFPEDSNIPIEDLTRYAWGLNLLKRVSTVEDGRNRIKRCVSNLKKANLLIDGDFPGCVKMHDLVLAFVLATVETGDHASFINHSDSSKWSGEDIKESCKRLSLTCTGMSEFSESFSKCPNLSLLKLMHGDDSYKFPQGFNENTENLRVIAYEKMQYPLLPRSLQSRSTNLRTLCLRECPLMFDISFIGDLSNLEVLSITKCQIQKLPSTIGKLKKLRVLDLTGCYNLLIDDGNLKKLVNLKELYMLGSYRAAIRFTNGTVDELVGCFENLTTLEIEFKALPKNMSFKKLERFKICLGCYLDKYGDQQNYSFENTLRLVTNKSELLSSKMYELFEYTKVLYLQADGINDLGVGLVESLDHHRFLYSNLRVLDIVKCANLTYLFTAHVANGLKNLAKLKVSSCPVLVTIVDGDSSGAEAIKFQALKFLTLSKLPKLTSLCNVVNVIELPQLMELQLDDLPKFTSIYPNNKLSTAVSSNISERQSFWNEEVVIPKLEKLHIYDMENLKEIWPNREEVNICILREITVKACNNLVNLLPRNPMSLFHHLEVLKVESCGSLEVLFNIDFGRVGKIEEASSSLRTIEVCNLEKLTEVVRVKGANTSGLFIRIHGFEAIEKLLIKGCKRFRNVFTPTNLNIGMRALTHVEIEDCGESGRSNEEQEINRVMSNEEISEEVVIGDTISNVVVPSYLIRTTFHYISTLVVRNHKSAEKVFEIESPSSSSGGLATTHNTLIPPPLLPNLKDLRLSSMECMSHVWKCNWNILLLLHKQQPQGSSSSSSFHNLTTIYLEGCKKVKYLFSPLMAKLLSNLKKIGIHECVVIEEVVSNRDDEYEDQQVVVSTSTDQTIDLLFHLDLLHLDSLANLKCIGGGGVKTWSTNQTSFNNTTAKVRYSIIIFNLSEVNVASWSLCQYTREIQIDSCEALPYVVPSYAVGQMQKLENLTIAGCNSMVEVFETQRISTSGCGTTNIDEGSSGPDATTVIPRLKVINVPQLFNLKKLSIARCDLLEYVFTSSTIECLMQLEELDVENCQAMKVIVKEENGENALLMTSKVVVFPCLKSIKLLDLPNLTGFFLGMNVFQWPLLDDVTIGDCPQMIAFTAGRSIAPNLNYIHTKLGKHSLECGLNFHAMPNLNQSTNSCPATSSKEMHSSFHNLIEVDVGPNYDLQSVFPSNKLLQLQKMEKIQISECNYITEVFETMEGEDIGFKSVVEIPKLREVHLEWLGNLKYIWKNNPWMVLQFPNLTKLSIDGCPSMEHVFTSSMVGSLLQLQELHIEYCHCMEVIVKEANVVVQEEERSDGKVNEVRLSMCDLVEEIFEAPERPDRELHSVVVKLPNLREVELKYLDILKYIWKNNPWMVLEFPNLTKLSIGRCESLEHVLTSSMVGSLLQLQDLHINDCHCMEVIVKEANVVVEWEGEGECNDKENEIIMLPRLKSLTLRKLSSLKGFCLGKEAFSWPSLDTLQIIECPEMSVFTKGDLATPELRVIDTNLRRCELSREESLNSFITTKHQQVYM